MARSKAVKASGRDEDNSASGFARAFPASDLLSRLIGERGAGELLNHGRGRPAKAVKKVSQTLSLDSDVLEAYRRQGAEWQTRINQVLREHMHDQEK